MAAKKTTTSNKAKKTTTKADKSSEAGADKTAETTASAGTAQSVRTTFDDVINGATDRAEEAIENAVRFAKDASYASIGAGLVVQDRLTERKFELVSYRTFLDEAKTKGHARVTEVQNFIEPIAKRVNDRVEPITDRIEAQLPAPVRDAIVDSRNRVRELLDA